MIEETLSVSNARLVKSINTALLKAKKGNTYYKVEIRHNMGIHSFIMLRVDGAGMSGEYHRNFKTEQELAAYLEGFYDYWLTLGGLK